MWRVTFFLRSPPAPATTRARAACPTPLPPHAATPLRACSASSRSGSAAASGDARQFLHLAANIAGFFAGGVVGTIAFHHLGGATLYLPSGLAAATALACAASHRYHPPSAP